MTHNSRNLSFLKLVGVIFIVLNGAGCKDRQGDGATPKGAFDSEDPSRDHPCSVANSTATFDNVAIVNSEVDSSVLTKRDWSVVRSAAMHSFLVYSTPSEIRQASRLWGYSEASIVEERSMQAYVASNRNCVVVSFRGTDFSSGKDWFANLSATMRKLGPEDGLHGGFLDAFDSMAGPLRRLLRVHGAEEKIVWVTGHSLGGALAGVFSFSNDVRESLPPFNSELIADRHKFKIEKVVTFGQPLFVDGNLAKKMRQKLHGRYLRVVNNKDLVAKIPPWFTHFGDLLWLKPNSVALLTENMSVGSVGDFRPEVGAAEIPEELAADEQSLAEYRLGRPDAASSNNGTPNHPQAVGSAVSDHSMVPYLNLVTQSWRQPR